jgi:uncharacterized protein (TIGR02594 family)
MGERVSRTGKWLRATIDNKPWWAIIVAACLASLGSELVKKVPEGISWGRTFFPVDATVYVFLKEKGGSSPVKGSKVSIMDTKSGDLFLISGSNEHSVTTSDKGYAAAKIRVMPGFVYALVLSYTDAGKVFQYTMPLEIRGDLQQPIEFDKSQWHLEGSTPDSLPASSGIVETRANLPPWMKFAYGESGQREIPGPQHNPRILAYFRATRAPSIPQDDETDWSSAFIHWVLDQAGIAGTRSLQDRSWMAWGKPSELKPGCVAVLWLGAPDSDHTHAGFFVGESEGGNLMILGGNQSDMVKISEFRKGSLLGCRWPA